MRNSKPTNSKTASQFPKLQSDSYNNNKKTLMVLIPIVAIALVVFTSGCIGQSKTSDLSANGLVIKGLYTDPPADKIRLGQRVNIFFEIENVGSSKAKNVLVELSGVNWLPPGSLELKYFINQINPPDSNTGFGQTKPVVFSIPTPTIPEGRTVTYPLRIRVTYNYGSSGTVVVNGYSEQRYQRDTEQNKLLPITKSLMNVQQSTLPSPIQVRIFGPDKIVVPPYPYEEYTYHITFTNVGDGVPITLGEDGLIYGGIWVTGPGAYFKDCLGVRNDLLSAAQYWTTPAGINSVTEMFDYYYRNQNMVAQVHYDDRGWAAAFQYVNDEIAIGYNAVSAFANYPTILDWQFLGNSIPPIKLQTGTHQVTRPCTIAIDNAGGWRNRETDTVSVNFDLRYDYYIEKEFSVSVTAPVIKNPVA